MTCPHCGWDEGLIDPEDGTLLDVDWDDMEALFEVPMTCLKCDRPWLKHTSGIAWDTIARPTIR